MTVVPKLIYRCNAILNQNPTHLALFLQKFILKFTWKGKGSTLAKTILQKNKAEGLLDFKTYYNAIIINPV